MPSRRWTTPGLHGALLLRASIGTPLRIGYILVGRASAAKAPLEPRKLKKNACPLHAQQEKKTKSRLLMM
jgi:hypothetical protein